MSLSVEKETRLQGQSRLWFTFRAGRVTASRMKSACHTNPANPSLYLSLRPSVTQKSLSLIVKKLRGAASKQEKIAQEIYLRAQKITM